MNPNPVNPRRDYREFGDMFFDRINDPLELNNGINDLKNQQKIAQLRAFYAHFKTQVSGIGMQEINNKKITNELKVQNIGFNSLRSNN